MGVDGTRVPRSRSARGSSSRLTRPNTCKKRPGGAVQERSPQLVAPAADSGQVSLHQLPEDFSAIDSTNGLNIGSQDGLTIGDHGQGFQRRRREPNFGRDMSQFSQPCGEGRTRQQLVTARDLLNAKRPTTPIVHLVQLANQCTSFRSIRQVGVLTQFPTIEGFAGEEQDGFESLEAGIARAERVADGPRRGTGVSEFRRRVEGWRNGS